MQMRYRNDICHAIPTFLWTSWTVVDNCLVTCYWTNIILQTVAIFAFSVLDEKLKLVILSQHL